MNSWRGGFCTLVHSYIGTTLSLWFHFAGSVIICAPPDSCIPEGESRTITCTRTLDLDFGSRFTVTSEDGTAEG